MSNQIHIRQVLALMDTYETGTKPIEFKLSFVTNDGEWRHLKRAAKGWKSGKTTLGGKSNFGYNLKSKNIVLIRDLDYNNGKGRTISVNIDGIRTFNGLTVFA
jgi:hypothetical protein